jgi:exosome complex RNA-binding protein Csl4
MVMSLNDLTIGTDVRRCPYCGEVLSFRDSKSFCRKCEREMHKVAVDYGKKL